MSKLQKKLKSVQVRWIADNNSCDQIYLHSLFHHKNQETRLKLTSTSCVKYEVE